MNIDTNSPEFKEAQHRAIEFYDAEHELTVDERRLLQRFFQKTAFFVMGCSTAGLLAGMGLPVYFRKGSRINAMRVGWGGVLGSMAATWIGAPALYRREVQKAKDDYGSESKVYNVIQHTPHGVFRSFFWSSYFAETAKNPELRIKDPRDVQSRLADGGDENSAWAKLRHAETDTKQPAPVRTETNSSDSPFDADPLADPSPQSQPARPARLIPNTAIVLAIGLGLYSLDARSAINEYVWCPLIRLLTDAETGHKLGVFMLKYGLSPKLLADVDDPVLQVQVFGQTLSNPLGMAAGFDKEGEAIDPLLDLGFSYVEIGSVTPFPQPGNPAPRFFRLGKDDAVINRYGFNSSGHWAVLGRLRQRYERLFAKNPGCANNSFRDDKLLGINLGKNKTGDEVQDYVAGVQRFGEYADVLVINVSSPNTPGLRDLQNEAKLTTLLTQVVAERNLLPGKITDRTTKPPVLVKIAPDLTEPEIESIAKAAKQAKVDGIIMSNTTVQRPQDRMLTTDENLLNQAGGLSGKPLKEISLKAFRLLRKHTKDSGLVLVGCGGISSGKDALDFARAGATFVQLYTAFAYRGPGLARKIKDEITEELKKENKTWMQVVGEDDK
ncbi:hypothetical protein KL930_002426 [Ogataea haglerorum]|nr:hypothetical protein KL930_002426 [Ogataea haglerorum]KAG7779025.1 hypothetical protein KL922_001510 [Ogataea haglerorum]